MEMVKDSKFCDGRRRKGGSRPRGKRVEEILVLMSFV
jgi:hypothetical protein